MITAGFLVMAVLVMTLVVLEARPRSGAGYGVVKIVASLWFCVVGVVVIDDIVGAPAARPLFLAALGFSFVGDVLLIPKGRKRTFLAGILAFLLAHVFYVPAFASRGLDVAVFLVVAAILIVPAIAVLRWLRPHVQGAMWTAVVVYVLVICTMLAAASGAVASGLSASGGVSPALLFGALAFWCSDIFVARQRFVSPGVVNRVIGLPLYFFAQLGLIAGFAP
jgi:uncharacterized membrane protein YhhN